MAKTINVLIERGLTSCKAVAVSHSRALLLDQAEMDHLNISRDELDVHSHVDFDEFTRVCIENVPLLTTDEPLLRAAEPLEWA